MKLLKSIAWGLLLIELPVIVAQLWCSYTGLGNDWNNLWQVPLLVILAIVFVVIWFAVGQELGVLPLEDEQE